MNSERPNTSIADAVAWAAAHAAKTPEEIDGAGLDLLVSMVRLFRGLPQQPSAVELVESIGASSDASARLGRIVRSELASDLAVPHEVVTKTKIEHDLTGVKLRNIHQTYRAPAGISRIAVFIGALFGAIAGVIAMLVLDATPVAVNVANQTANVGVSSAVDQPWFIAVTVMLTALIGGAVGSLKQTWRDVTYVSEVCLVPAERSSNKEG